MMTIFEKGYNSQSHDDEICQRIREIMMQGHLNMGSYSDDVDVHTIASVSPSVSQLLLSLIFINGLKVTDSIIEDVLSFLSIGLT